MDFPTRSSRDPMNRGKHVRIGALGVIQLALAGGLLAIAPWRARAAELPVEEPPAPSTAGARINPRAPLIELIRQSSVISPSPFSLVTHRYVARYSESLYGLPAVFVGISTRIGFTGRLEDFLQGKVGYAGKSGSIPVAARGPRGEELAASTSESVRLHWLPVGISAKALY